MRVDIDSFAKVKKKKKKALQLVIISTAAD